MSALAIAAWTELGVCWIVWLLAFVRPHQRAKGQKKTARAASSRLGIAFVLLAYGCIWAFVMPAGFHKSTPSLLASMIVGPPSVALAWAAARHLDKQWGFEASLSQDHQLITSGPYRWIRHPIYTSMLGMLLQTGLTKTWWPLLLAGIIFYLIGTEIRVRAEDRLLAERFGQTFERYKSATRAYLPGLR